MLFDEDFLFQDAEGKSTYKTDYLPNSDVNGPLTTKSLKNRSTVNKPTKQWINRCNGDKDSYSNLIDVEQISKLLVSLVFNIFSVLTNYFLF